MAISTQNNYGSFLQKRDILLSLIARQIYLLSRLDIKTWEETLENLRERVSTDAFKVLVIGEFKRGKSTFINAMLGEEILPAQVLPCTGIINEVKWGNSSRAVLHYLPQEDGLKRQPEEISVDKIEEYVVIKHEAGEDYINPYEKVEIFYPLELCRSGVEIIDSPGLNENSARSQIVEDYLPIVDATLFVLSCEALVSQSELRAIEIMRAFGHEDIFFICNRFDLIRRRERESVKQFGITKLAPLSKLSEEGIFFISAADALDGRLDGDEQLLQKSGVPILEESLEKFLTTERGRLKIVEPAQSLRESIKVARETIPDRIAMFQTSYGELEARYLAAQEPLKLLEVKRKQIGKRIDQFCQDIRSLVLDKSNNFYSELPDKIQKWIQNYELQTEIDLSKVIEPIKEQPWNIHNLNINKALEIQVKAIVEEISSYVTKQVEDEFIPWQSNEIQPFIASRLEILKEDLDARASDFIREVDELRSQLASGESSSFTKNSISSLERLFTAAGMPTLSNYEWMQGVLGLGKQKTQRTLGGILTIGMIVLTGTLLLPLIGIGVISSASLALVALIQGVIGGEIAQERLGITIKEETAKRFSQEIYKSRNVQAKKIASDIFEQLIKIKYIVEKGLTQEIKNLEDQVESVLEEKKKGQASVDRKISELKAIAEELTVLENDLDILLDRLILTALE